MIHFTWSCVYKIFQYALVYLIDLDAQLEKMNKEQKEMQTNLENWRVRDKDANNVTNPSVEGVYLMPIISTYISLSKM